MVEAVDGRRNALEKVAVDPRVLRQLPDGLLVLVCDLEELHLPAAHVDVVGQHDEVEHPEDPAPPLLPDQAQGACEADPVSGPGRIHDVVPELDVDLAGELAGGELLGPLLDCDPLGVYEYGLLGDELETPPAVAGGALLWGLEELVGLVQEDGFSALATAESCLGDVGLDVGGPDDDAGDHHEAAYVLCAYPAEEGLGRQPPEPDVHPFDLVGVDGIPHPQLGEGRYVEVGHVVLRVVEDLPGELHVEGVNVLEVDDDGFLALHRHLGEGLLVLDLVLLVPEAFDEPRERLLGLNQTRHLALLQLLHGSPPFTDDPKKLFV